MSKSYVCHFVIGALCGAAHLGLCQDPVAALLKTQQLSTIPGVYQGSVEPGSLLILRDHGRTVAFEDASDMAEGMKRRPAAFTLGQEQLALVNKVTLTAKLFGYEPAASFASGTQLSYDASVFSGTRLTGFQMTNLITTDPETMKNIKGWFWKGFHVYLVEAVLATPKLYVTASKVGGISVALNKSLTSCTSAPPVLPTAVNASQESNANAVASNPVSSQETNNQAGSGQKANTAKLEKPSGEQNDGTKVSTSLAVPVAVEADICKGSAGHYGLNSPAPVNLAVKLEEIVLSQDEAGKQTYDYVPAVAVF